MNNENVIQIRPTNLGQCQEYDIQTECHKVKIN